MKVVKVELPFSELLIQDSLTRKEAEALAAKLNRESDPSSPVLYAVFEDAYQIQPTK